MTTKAMAWLGGALAVALCATVAGAAAQAAKAPPDFTGVWTTYRDPAAGPPRPGAFGRRGPDLPFTEPAKKKIAEYHALVDATQDNPGGHCLGTGMPGSMMGSGGYPMEIVQRPEEMVIVYEAHQEVRRVYFGDRGIKPEDRISGRNGYSSGHWEGDKLVVETDWLKEQVDQAYAHSDKARITERYHLEKDAKGGKVLVNEWTMTDPDFLTAPVSGVKKWSFDVGGHVLPYECDEATWEDHLDALKRKAAGLPPKKSDYD